VVALIVFLTSCLLIVYVYIGYPLLVTVWARQRTKPRPLAVFPRVTLVFCAHNEEAVLPEKIANCCALDYPAGLLEFCVGSDGSTDETNALLQAWAADPRVQVLLSSKREGKTTLLNRIVPTVKGDVVLFSDASTLFTPEAVRRHVAHYADPQVGCVGGDLEFVNTAHSPVSGAHGVYWRYESHVRQCESSLGILAYVAGANYSMRRELWRTVAPHFADDCNSPLNVIEQGYRVVYDPLATAQEVAAESSEGLMRRRVRMVTRDLEATLARPVLLNPLRFPGIAWSLWSHKILRWLGAPLLVVLLVSNLFLLEQPLFQGILVLQVAFYALSLVGYWLQGKTSSRWLSLPLYFSLSNLATLLGLVHILQRKRAATWQPGGRR
jgi:biofilm PGA synthesis N-glycosyltransferase PgaC